MHVYLKAIETLIYWGGFIAPLENGSELRIAELITVPITPSNTFERHQSKSKYECICLKDVLRFVSARQKDPLGYSQVGNINIFLFSRLIVVCFAVCSR